MAVPERRRSRNWRFADSGSRFDVNPRVAARDRQPIAPTFTRKIVRCRRCGSRIVSNARRCPYCSKSVVPFYRTFAFWLSLVLLLAACTVYFVVFFNPATEPPAGSGVRAPLALGVPNPQETTNLPLGTSVDSNDLIITVMSVRQVGTASDGRTIYEVALQLFNKTPNRQALYTTQWQMQNLDGSREECFRGKTSDGSSLTNGVDGRQMAPDEVFTTKIYFATDNPLCVIFLQNPLDVENGSDVSWDVGLLAAPPDQGSPEPDSGQQ